MGHREDLLLGAKRCLYEKGYSRTTARDIVSVSQTNLASISYHYGNKETLLREALVALMREWGDSMVGSSLLSDGAQTAADQGPATERGSWRGATPWAEEQGPSTSHGAGTQVAASQPDPVARYEEVWTRVIEQLPASRPLWAVNFEMLAEIPHDDRLRATIAAAQGAARDGLAEVFSAAWEDSEQGDQETVRLLGSFHQALLTGVLAQWMIDPDSALQGGDVVRALRLVTASMGVAEDADPGDTTGTAATLDSAAR